MNSAPGQLPSEQIAKHEKKKSIATLLNSDSEGNDSDDITRAPAEE